MSSEGLGRVGSEGPAYIFTHDKPAAKSADPSEKKTLMQAMIDSVKTSKKEANTKQVTRSKGIGFGLRSIAASIKGNKEEALAQIVKDMRSDPAGIAKNLRRLSPEQIRILIKNRDRADIKEVLNSLSQAEIEDAIFHAHQTKVKEALVELLDTKSGGKETFKLVVDHLMSQRALGESLQKKNPEKAKEIVKNYATVMRALVNTEGGKSQIKQVLQERIKELGENATSFERKIQVLQNKKIDIRDKLKGNDLGKANTSLDFGIAALKGLKENCLSQANKYGKLSNQNILEHLDQIQEVLKPDELKLEEPLNNFLDKFLGFGFQGNPFAVFGSTLEDERTSKVKEAFEKELKNIGDQIKKLPQKDKEALKETETKNYTNYKEEFQNKFINTVAATVKQRFGKEIEDFCKLEGFQELFNQYLDDLIERELSSSRPNSEGILLEKNFEKPSLSPEKAMEKLFTEKVSNQITFLTASGPISRKDEELKNEIFATAFTNALDEVKAESTGKLREVIWLELLEKVATKIQDGLNEEIKWKNAPTENDITNMSLAVQEWLDEERELFLGNVEGETDLVPIEERPINNYLTNSLARVKDEKDREVIKAAFKNGLETINKEIKELIAIAGTDSTGIGQVKARINALIKPNYKNMFTSEIKGNPKAKSFMEDFLGTLKFKNLFNTYLDGLTNKRK